MEQEDLKQLAAKVRDGEASNEEITAFLKEMNVLAGELKQALESSITQ